MLAIALTGGIGSGKSTVGALLQHRDGVVLVETDVLAREALAPGGPGVPALAERFPGVVSSDGVVDRTELASVVFADEEARRALEAIVHPIVRAGVFEMLERYRESADLVVIDVPLFVETGGRARYPVAGVLVVDAPVELCRERLVATRGMTEAEANARIAAQATREQRIAAADFVIVNVGTLDELEEMVANAWSWCEQLAAEQSGASPN